MDFNLLCGYIFMFAAGFLIPSKKSWIVCIAYLACFAGGLILGSRLNFTPYNCMVHGMLPLAAGGVVAFLTYGRRFRAKTPEQP